MTEWVKRYRQWKERRRRSAQFIKEWRAVHVPTPAERPPLRFLIEPLVTVIRLTSRTLYFVQQCFAKLHNKLYVWMIGGYKRN